MNDKDFNILSVKSLALYVVAVATVGIIFRNLFLGWHWVMWGIGSIVLFFGGTCLVQKTMKDIDQKKFLLLIFFIALIIRVLYVWLMCYYYTFHTGKPMEFCASDSMSYHNTAVLIKNAIAGGQFGEFVSLLSQNKVMYSDMGYVMSLSFIYYIFGTNILVPRIIHALLSAYLCVVIYKLCNRVFDNRTARLAAAFSVVMPLFIYYCGLHLKESDFAFFLILCVERIDFVMRERKNIVWNIFLIVFSLLMVFSYRVSTGVCMIFSFLVYIFVNQNVTKKIKIVAVTAASALFVALMLSGMGWEIVLNFKSALFGVDYNFQYLPGEFVLPLPKFTAEGNENQKLINGMVFVKNIIGFFAMYSFIVAYREKKLREISLVALLPLTYLAIVSSVSFFSVERFYFPALPFLMVLAAYGMSHFDKKDTKWFNAFLAVLLVAILAWSYVNVSSL